MRIYSNDGNPLVLKLLISAKAANIKVDLQFVDVNG